MGWGGQVSSALSANILLCRVPHIFSFLAVALLVWFILRIFAAGGALLLVVATFLVRSRCSDLQRRKNGKSFEKQDPLNFPHYTLLVRNMN